MIVDAKQLGDKVVKAVVSENLEEVQSFLNRFEESAQILINNLRDYGPSLTDHHNSGNFKIVQNKSEITSVFCLTRRGNLIAQSSSDSTDEILTACKGEEIPLKGFIGPWNVMRPLVEALLQTDPSFKITYESKEIQYAYDLKTSDSKLTHHPQVRLLNKSDFAQWLEFGDAYMHELSLPNELSKEHRRNEFVIQVTNKVWWGLFHGDELISRAGLNSKSKNMGQVGGVFTPKKFRQRGYAKSVMYHLLKDCMQIHGHKKNVLFTGEEDIPAQKLYEAVGYSRIGHFAMAFGESVCGAKVEI